MFFEVRRLSTPPTASAPLQHVPHLEVVPAAGRTLVGAAEKGEVVKESIPTQGITEWHTYHKVVQHNIKHKLNHSTNTKFVDKLMFKEYCRSKGVRTVETLASYPQSEYATIPFASFGGDFAIKSNKACGRNLFISGNFSDYNESKIRKVISLWGEDFTNVLTEQPQYEFTTPQIFLDPLLSPVPPDIKTYMYGDEIAFVRLKVGPRTFATLDSDFEILNTSVSRYKWIKKAPDNYDAVHALQSDQLKQWPIS